jgi:hypothetical protein
MAAVRLPKKLKKLDTGLASENLGRQEHVLDDDDALIC